MTRPDDIPQGVWDAAGDAAGELTDVIYEFLADKISGKDIDRNDVSMRIIGIISRPIMAEREACATIADDHSQILRGNFDRSSAISVEGVATAIRSRP